MDKDCSFCTDEVRPCRAAWGSSSHPADGGIPPPSGGQGQKSRGSFWIQLLFWMGKAAMWISFCCGTREERAKLQQYRGLSENGSAPETVCKGWRGELYPTQPSNSLVVTFQLVVLCENISHRTHLSAHLLLSKGSRHRTLLPALCISPFPSGSGAFCGSDAALAPWQSFEEPRCDLRENLLRSGCGEASIVYTQGEMRTLKVRAGDTARAQPLLRGPSAFSRLLSWQNIKPRLLFM